jgi:hypothetical protein
MEDGGRQGETMENREPERTGSIHEELGEDETVKTVFGLLPAAPIITSVMLLVVLLAWFGYTGWAIGVTTLFVIALGVSYVLWRQRIRSRG